LKRRKAEMNIKRIDLLVFASILILFLILSCNKKSELAVKKQSIEEKRSEGGELILYNWEEYIGVPKL
jgi:hypothetical protein